MRVFYVSASFAGSYGGPAYSVSRLACSVARTGATTGLWAPDGSAVGLSLPEPSPHRLAGSLKAALAAFGPVDILHDSGLWRPHNNSVATQAARSGTPLVVSTRGMLDPWALDHKRLKKALAWHVYQKRNLNRAAVLHVTSMREKESVGRLCLRPRVRFIPNGIDLPAESRRAPEDRPRRALFLGRLHPVKGLAILLDAWASLRPAGWELVLAGPDENGYRKVLEAQAARLRLNDSVSFPGPVTGAAKEDLLRGATFLVLPSLSESFGMVVAEACAIGLPVVTTKAVPWAELEESGCGFRSAPGADALAAALDRMMRLPETTLVDMGQRARKLVDAKFRWGLIAEQFVDVYREIQRHR